MLFEVISDSMVPTFRRGEQVLIRELAAGEPRPGQIVAVHRGMLVTHRYLGDGRCQGDNALSVDTPFAAEAAVGVATSVVRGGRQHHLSRTLPLRTRLHRMRLQLHALKQRWLGRG
jgi:hypothetical protein